MIFLFPQSYHFGSLALDHLRMRTAGFGQDWLIIGVYVKQYRGKHATLRETVFFASASGFFQTAGGLQIGCCGAVREERS